MKFKTSQSISCIEANSLEEQICLKYQIVHIVDPKYTLIEQWITIASSNFVATTVAVSSNSCPGLVHSHCPNKNEGVQWDMKDLDPTTMSMRMMHLGLLSLRQPNRATVVIVVVYCFVCAVSFQSWCSSYHSSLVLGGSCFGSDIE